MERVRVAICDDENTALDIISAAVKTEFSKRGITAEIDKYINCKELQRKIERIQYDLLILDIETPYLDGISFGKELRARGNRVNIIYVSNREDKVFDSFQVNPNGFIRKNHFLKDIAVTLDNFINIHMEKEEDIIVVEERGQIFSLNIKDILYIEGSRKNQVVYIKGKDKPIYLSQTMQRLEELLFAKGFIRIHKGYIVNYLYIYLISEEELTLKDDIKLPISRRRVKDIKERYLMLMQKNDIVTI